jgi:hypothetical protein
MQSSAVRHSRWISLVRVARLPGLDRLVGENVRWYSARMPLHSYVSAVCYLAIPVFIVLAYRGWARRPPQALSNWRSRLGVTSMLVISVDWCSVIIVVLTWKSSLSWVRSIGDNWFDYVPLPALLTTFLSFALQGRARVYCIAASLAMILFWSTSWVE